MQRKVASAMPQARFRGKATKADAQPLVIALPAVEAQGLAGLTPMNFRVPTEFHREVKLFAVQHGVSTVELRLEDMRTK
ncbi:MAG: hypothetical protein WBW33_22205 [Bryobacteraceae bacterium]